MMGIHLRLFHNSDKLFGVYNGLFDSPVMYPNWGRVSHLLVKLLLSCYFRIHGVSARRPQFLWYASLLGFEYSECVFLVQNSVPFEMFSMMMCPQEKERCYSKLGFMFRTSGFCGGDPLWVDTVVWVWSSACVRRAINYPACGRHVVGESLLHSRKREWALAGAAALVR